MKLSHSQSVNYRAFRSVLYLLGLYVLWATPSARAAQATLTADAHVNSAMPAVNSGAISNLDVGGGYTTFLQFDLSLLPSGTTASQVTRAVLRVYANRVTTPGSIAISPVTSAWGEYSITYATEPAIAASTASVPITQAGAIVAVDVTSMVQGWITTPAANNGIALSTTSASVQFDSKESDLTAHPATLEIDLANSGPAGPAGATGPIGLAGPTGPAGPQGSPGSAGAIGPPGPIGLQGMAGPAGATGASGPQGLPGSVGPNGPIGPQGLQGIAGQAGAQGIPGATGASGLSGPMGPQGPAGPVGISFKGVYDSTANYALADGVSYNGAGYVSLVDSNHGNTPGLSPLQWALFAAAGSTGATGPAGLTGPSGPAGPIGPQGLPGPSGAAGATGPQGPAVANYLGNYQSAVNYALNDAVSWQGSTYISLVAANAGNTPSLSPTQWTVLAAQGATGATGPAGLPGTPGATGPAGATGAPGPQGPPITFRSGWLIGTQYALGDAVSYSGSAYIALTANLGREPDLTPQYWGLLASAGATGPAGATGATGLQGPAGYSGQQGPIGPQGLTGSAGATGPAGAVGPAGTAGPIGPTGVAGLPGILYRGTYASVLNYALNDSVTYLGSTYISLSASNLGNTPDVSPLFWSVIAQQGTAGAPGAAGAAGLQGPSGAPGATGATGPQGPAGPAGARGLNYRGTWVIAAGYAVNDSVTLDGTTYIAQVANSSNQPDQYPQTWAVFAQAGSTGPSGPSGPSGAAATLAVGTVTTAPAGSPAVVTNSGTAANAILNFSIPQGAPGSSGGGGSTGNTSPALLSTYHDVSFSNLFFSVASPTSSPSELAPILTWIPSGCTASALNVYSQQSNTITVTLRAGTPGSMTSTTLACAASPSVACTETGSVSIPVGGFIDLNITGASGTSAAVWTSLTCN